MTMKVYRVLGIIFAWIVLTTTRVADFISDSCFWIKQFFVNLWRIWKLIWSGAELSNAWHAIKLSFGAILMAGKMATDSLRQMSQKRAVIRRDNVIMGTTNTWMELALFHLHPDAANSSV